MSESYAPTVHLTPRQEVLRGMRDMVPLVVGATPFGLIFGTLAASSNLSAGAAVAMSVLVFAGSAQFVSLGLLAAGTAVPLVILTTFVVNLRHLLYAVTLMPHLQGLDPKWKLLFSFWLTDESFAVGIGRYNQPDQSPHKHWYLLGANALMYGNWVLCTVLGVTLGQQLPNAAALGLDFAMVVTFIGLVVPYLTTRPMLLATAVAGLVALAAHGLPHQLGLFLAAIAGLITAALSDPFTPEAERDAP
ncbi:MAG: branched-chain amino acid ABC transporter permease [Leptolyngbya sp. DLM2.Bin27]|nr:MAG: branched-chain amino acid ABC transporter permease [Leptolyngbya sp. DLM2.Bin27]